MKHFFARGWVIYPSDYDGTTHVAIFYTKADGSVRYPASLDVRADRKTAERLSAGRPTVVDFGTFDATLGVDSNGVRRVWPKRRRANR